MMRKVLIHVEGVTEETFVRDVLRPHFESRGLMLQAVLLKTKRVPDGPDFRGGHVPYAIIEREIRRLLGDTSACAVTTMYDLYALPHDFPRFAETRGASARVRAELLESALKEQIGHERLRPYLQLHEFEALLFTDVPKIGEILGAGSSQVATLRREVQSFASPEEIDDGVKTAPSKRLQRAFPGYQKVLHGPRIAQLIGLAALRDRCSHFGEWVSWLEELTL